MSQRHWVEVVEVATGKTVRSMGPFTERSAAKAELGININLDHERFFTRITESASKPADQP